MITIIYGTRPEIIKLSSIIHTLEKRAIAYRTIHTKQHYSTNMDEVFFSDLSLPLPTLTLSVGNRTHGDMTGSALIGIEKDLIENRPTYVLVQGDTNSALAGALAATKLGIPVGHVEAGLRSYDRRMPEETNRVLIDHVSDLLFAPTPQAKKNLLSEGISRNKIKVVGNTIADALIYAALATDLSRDLEFSINEPYFLTTIHRQENVDDISKLAKIIKSLQNISRHFKRKIIMPIHPRTNNLINKHKISTTHLTLIEPLSYFNFYSLMKKASLILTDSGGIQEEACILQIPCITLRLNTERPETVQQGANILVGSSYAKLIRAISYFEDAQPSWTHPYGDGHTSERIIDAII